MAVHGGVAGQSAVEAYHRGDVGGKLRIEREIRLTVVNVVELAGGLALDAVAAAGDDFRAH